MKLAKLTERFYDLVAPDIPNEWDVEEVMEAFMDESAPVCDAILGHIPVIWPVSHSLCFDFLRLLPKTLQHLSLEQIPRWIGITLDHYEVNGLRAAQRFMQDDIEAYLLKLRGTGGLNFGSVEKKLLPYIRGVARDERQIGQARQIYTDTSTIFVPEELSVFTKNQDNFLLYKLILTFQWGFIACGSFIHKPPKDSQHLLKSEDGLWLNAFIESFAQPLLARDIYHSLESIRVMVFLEQELPGLIRAARKQIFPHLSLSNNNHPLYGMQEILITEENKRAEQLSSFRALAETNDYLHGLAFALDSARLTTTLYSTFEKDSFEYVPLVPFAFQGVFKLRAVETARKSREQKMGEQFVDMMEAHLLSLSDKELGKLLKQDKRDSADYHPYRWKAGGL